MKRGNNELISKVTRILMILLLLVPLFTRSIKADMGPKPSIRLTFDQLFSNDYFVVLLSEANGGSGPNGPLTSSNFDMENVTDELMEALKSYHDADDYVPWNMIRRFNDTNTVSWTYFAPAKFKIAIYKADGTLVAVSEKIVRETFAGYFKCTLNGNRIEVKDNYDYLGEIIRFLGRMGLTVMVEVGIGLLFGFRSTKEIITIIVVNIITQLLLNGYITIDKIYGGGLSSFILLFPAEAVIIAIECVVYSIAFKNKRGKAIVYGFLANFASALLTLTTLAL